MHSGNPYKGMEVKINEGHAKMHHSTIIHTIQKDNRFFVVVQMTTCTLNYKLTLPVKSVTELK